MLDDQTHKGHSDTDISILLKEGIGKVLLASAERERALSIEIQQLKDKISQLECEKNKLTEENAELRRQNAFLQSIKQNNTITVTGNYINNQYNNQQQ
jgi:FtsZ-binding cell division protein ZapB